MAPLDDYILNSADLRWHRLVEKQPDLAPAIDLQRIILTRTLELSNEAPDVLKRSVTAPPGLLDRLASREVPVLNLAVEFQIDRVVPHLLGFCNDFAAGGAGEPARNVHNALKQGDIDAGSLLHGSLLRQQASIRTRANHLGISPDLVWLVAELSVAPLANHLQHSALVSPMTSSPAAIHAAQNWPLGHCAACGSWPAFAETHSQERHLRCSFCGADWTPATNRCVYCNKNGEAFLRAADPKQPCHQLEFCRTCGGYLKHAEVTRATPFALLPVLDLEMTYLDIHAVEQGYARPSMPERLASGNPCPPEA